MPITKASIEQITYAMNVCKSLCWKGVRAWNYAAYGPHAMENNYFFERIEGYDAMQGEIDDEGNVTVEPEADALSGLTVADDLTLEVTLAAPFADCRFCPTGGITAATAPEWLAFDPVLCVGGSWVVPAGPPDPAAIEAAARAAAALAQ